MAFRRGMQPAIILISGGLCNPSFHRVPRRTGRKRNREIAMHDPARPALKKVYAYLCLTISFLFIFGCSERSSFSSQGGGQNLSVHHKEASPGQRIAFSHSFLVKIPNGQVEVTQSRDIEKCRALKCTILSTNLDREDDGTIDASLSIRLPPEGLPEFVQTLGSPPARIVRHSNPLKTRPSPSSTPKRTRRQGGRSRTASGSVERRQQGVAR